MEKTFGWAAANALDVQTIEPPVATHEQAISGDAMLGWMTDEEFDVVADSIVGHFESLAGDQHSKDENEGEASIAQVVDWLLKEGVKLMPDSALKYLHSLIEQQLKEKDAPGSIYNGQAGWTTERSVVKSDVY